jgi:hypothetical protein
MIFRCVSVLISLDSASSCSTARSLWVSTDGGAVTVSQGAIRPGGGGGGARWHGAPPASPCT